MRIKQIEKKQKQGRNRSIFFSVTDYIAMQRPAFELQQDLYRALSAAVVVKNPGEEPLLKLLWHEQFGRPCLCQEAVHAD